MPEDDKNSNLSYLNRFKQKLTEFALSSDTAMRAVFKFGEQSIKSGIQELQGVKEDKVDMLTAVTRAAQKAFEQTKHNPNFKKALAHILTTGMSSQQKKRRQGFQEKYGFNAPGFLTISPTKLCNLKCKGCYAISSSAEHDTLSWDIFDKIMKEKRELWGSNFTVISGGEPLLYRDEGHDLLDMVAKYNDNFFLMYTNGTLINKEVAQRMAELGNITPAISVEGYKEETDDRRGEGVYDKIMQAMQNLKEAGVVFGISITALRCNAEKVVEEEFFDYYFNKLGATYAWIFQYMPIGREQTLDLQITPEQRYSMWKKTKALVKKGYFVADFWNSACVSSGCISAGKSYFYIDWNGNVTPCVFNPYAPVNIHDIYREGKTLNDMALHPFFQDIRRWQQEYAPPNQPAKTGNYLMPCAIRDHYKMMRGLIDKHHPKPIDESAAEALQDESYQQGLQDYDKRLADIMDPVWQQEYLDKG